MKKIYLLMLLPYCAFLLLVPVVNRVEPYIFGLPFLLFWLILWTIGTSVIMFTIYQLDTIDEE